MSSFCKLIVMGRVVRDPELRFTPNNTAVCGWSLAVNRTWKNAAGEKQEEATYIDCEGWGRLAEMVNTNFKKGRSMLADGRLRTDSWEDKATGQKRSKLKMVVESVSFTDSKPKSDGNTNDDIPE